MTATHTQLEMTRPRKHHRNLVKLPIRVNNCLLGTKGHKRNTSRGRPWVSAPPLQVRFVLRIDHPMSREDTTSPKPTCMRIGNPKPRHLLYTEVDINQFLIIKLNFLDGR